MQPPITNSEAATLAKVYYVLREWGRQRLAAEQARTIAASSALDLPAQPDADGATEDGSTPPAPEKTPIVTN